MLAKITYNILKKYAKTPSFGENILKILGFTDKDTKMLMALTTAKKTIIMDEATSSIDSITESMIQAALDNLLIGRPAIIIA